MDSPPAHTRNAPETIKVAYGLQSTISACRGVSPGGTVHAGNDL